MPDSIAVTRVLAIEGQALAKDKNGALRALRVGDATFEGDVILTAPHSRVNLATSDGRALVLRANETLTIDAEVTALIKPDATDAALLAGGGDMDKAIKAINQSSLNAAREKLAAGKDLSAALEDAMAGALPEGPDGGSTFVRLLRVVEGVTPLSFEFDTARPGVVLEIGTEAYGNADQAPASGAIIEQIQAAPDTGTVHEAALANGTLPASTGETLTGNLLSNDFSPTTMSIDQLSFSGTDYTAVGGVITADTPLGLLQVYTLSGTYDGVARQAGDYVYTLQTNSTGGDNVREAFTYRITDGSASSTASLSINITDDSPIGGNVTPTSTSPSATHNLVLVIDTSASMAWDAAGRRTYDPAFDVNTLRIQTAKAALADLIASYDSLGKVNVQIVDFNSSVTESGWYVDNAAGAIDHINALQANGGTRYSLALNTVMDGFTKPPADNTLFYFVTDGLPNLGFEATTVQPAWEAFVAAQGSGGSASIAYAVGIGTANIAALNPIAYPKGDADADGAQDYAVMLSDPRDLATTLLSTVDGGAFVGNMSAEPGSRSGFLMGADGGLLHSVVVDGTTYTHLVGGANSVTVDTNMGGRLSINFVTGAYDYQVVLTKATQGQQEVFAVTAIDNDGDMKTVNLIVNLDYLAKLDAQRDIILTNVATGTPIDVSTAALMHNDRISSAGQVSSVQNALNGTSSGPVLIAGINTVRFTPTGAPATTIVVREEALQEWRDNPLNNVQESAMDLTDRSRYGTVLPGGQAWDVDQAGATQVLRGTLLLDEAATRRNKQQRAGFTIDLPPLTRDCSVTN
jgi:hypothetical protein